MRTLETLSWSMLVGLLVGLLFLLFVYKSPYELCYERGYRKAEVYQGHTYCLEPITEPEGVRID